MGLPLPGLLLSDEADQETTGTGKAKGAIPSHTLEGLPPAPTVRAGLNEWLDCEGFGDLGRECGGQTTMGPAGGWPLDHFFFFSLPSTVFSVDPANRCAFINGR